MNRSVKLEGPAAVVGCGLLLGVFSFVAFLAASMTNFVLGTLFGVTLPFVIAVVVGIIGSEVALPLTVLCIVLRIAGVHVPVFR